MADVQSSTDRIEKTIMLRASRARVWRALTDAQEFGHWFGVKFDGPFKLNTLTRGTIAATKVDPEVAKAQQPYVGMPFEMTIERLDAERVFAFRWHPYAIDPAVDYSSEPTTLVTFALEDADKGTLLTVTESGFDRIPLARRAQAFTANAEGWTMMVSMIEKYVTHAT
jgi:uncharacterized protein YndB with AHSA1/START domain